MAEYNPELPVLTLAGTISGDAVGKNKYGINDSTGLGPNGSDKYISYDIIINNISPQSVGDASVRDSSGLSVGGQYTGIDIKVGDWVSDTAGTKILKIVEVQSKGDSFVSCSVEDVGMAIARSRSDRNNSFLNGTAVVVFEANDEDHAVFAINQLDEFEGALAASQVENYFKIYNPFYRFTLYPENTGSLEIGDFVTITSSGTPYNLVKASQDDIVIGTVTDLFGGNNVSIKPTSKIITNFDSPELLSSGQVGSIWYLSGSNILTTESNNNSNQPRFIQLTSAQSTQVTGSYNNPTLLETQYDLIINGFTVIDQDADNGSNLTIEEITSSINLSASLTFVSASIYNVGGGTAQTYTAGPSGTGGETGTLAYPPDLFIPLSGTPNPTGSYPSAPGKFSITHSYSGGEDAFVVHVTTSNAQYATYPVADEVQIATDIYLAAQATGSSVSASYGTNVVYIFAGAEGNLTVNELSNDPFGQPVVGAGSGTGISTGEFEPAGLEKYLTLTRVDGGNILLQGTWLDQPQGAGLYSVASTPPYLLTLGVVKDDKDWYIAETYLSSSKDVLITASLHINRQDSSKDFLIITSGSYDAFKINSEGIAQFFAHPNEFEPTAILGGMYFTSGSAYLGLE